MFYSVISLLSLLTFDLLMSTSDGHNLKIDCHPDPQPTKAECQKRRCIWQVSDAINYGSQTQTHVLNAGPPYCFYSSDGPHFPGYKMVRMTKYPKKYKLTLRRKAAQSIFGNDARSLKVELGTISDSIWRLRFKDANKSNDFNREIIGHPKLARNLRFKRLNENRYKVSFTLSKFGIKLSRKNGDILFDSQNIPGLTFSKQFLQISTKIPPRVFGLGENVRSTFRRDLNWTRVGMFARDTAPRGDNSNLYSSFPFFLAVSNSGQAHGVFLANTHAAEVAMQPDPNILTFRTIGGLIDLWIFAGPTPDDVISQFTSTVGRPQLPPYWGLGFQLCRFGYKNLTFLETVFQRNRDARIPQDVQYTDIDYMANRKDFTIDQNNFKDLKKFVTRLHSMNMKYVPIIDPGISASARNYEPLTRGVELDIFMKSGQNTSRPFEGKCWEGPTYWPDWTHPRAYQYWLEMHQSFKNLVPFDGVWNDMNEPSNEINGDVTGCARNEFNNPPYVPLMDQTIVAHTACMDAVHFTGLHYELHNLYGYTETMISYKVLRAVYPGKRPFVLSRSTFAGSGTHAAKWTGDISSTWDQLQWSIVGLFDFNLFGIPWVGADVCGFDENTNEELCVRWHQLGAFYPFMRNHNSIENTVEQDPAAWSPGAIDAIRKAISLRYLLLPYLYTLLFHAHTPGRPVVRPLFYQFPFDSKTYDINDQLLWGKCLMVAPALLPSGSYSENDVNHARQHTSAGVHRVPHESITQALNYSSVTRTVFFPKGTWYRFFDGKPFHGPATQNYTVAFDEVPLFVYQGSIFPVQDPGLTTKDSRRNPFDLVVANSSEGAEGDFYVDDGEDIHSTRNGKYSFWAVKAQFGANGRSGDAEAINTATVTLKPHKSGYPARLDNLRFYGLNGLYETAVKIDGNDVTEKCKWSKVGEYVKLELPSLKLGARLIKIEIQKS